MAQYKETVNTEKALNLIAKMLAGEIEQIDFTKIKVSDKDYSLLSIEELQKLEELEEIKQETLVSEKVLLDDNTVNVHGIIYNTDLENSYYLRTIGLYANDPDEGEILYSITPASHADYVPTPNGNNITTLIIDLKTVISGAIVNLQGNPSALVDVSMLNKKLDRGEGLEDEFDTGVKIVNELKKKQNKEDSSLLTTVKNIVGAINELFSNKLEKGGYAGNAKNLNDEISKKASKTTLGRVLIGVGIEVDEQGRISLAKHTHKVEELENFEHNHDPLYYRKNEIDTKIEELLKKLTIEDLESLLGNNYKGYYDANNEYYNGDIYYKENTIVTSLTIPDKNTNTVSFTIQTVASPTLTKVMSSQDNGEMATPQLNKEQAETELKQFYRLVADMECLFDLVNNSDHKICGFAIEDSARVVRTNSTTVFEIPTKNYTVSFTIQAVENPALTKVMTASQDVSSPALTKTQIDNPLHSHDVKRDVTLRKIHY